MRTIKLGTALAAIALIAACAEPTVAPPYPGAAADLVSSSSSGTLVITSNTTLAEDHHGTIAIEADNVTLDCAGHTVFGPGEPGYSGGISVGYLRTGVTVTRCTVTGFDVNGIFGAASSDGHYEANIIHDNAGNGMNLDNGSNNVVVGNTSRSNGGIGIVLTRSSGCRIERDTVVDNKNWAGIALFDGSHDNVVTDNTALRNVLGFVLDGAVHNELRDNTANWNSSQGFVLVRGANDNVLEFNSANLNLAGFEITAASNSNTLRSNVANRNSFEGFKIFGSDGNALTDNTGNMNGSFGFLVFGGSSLNLLTGNVGRNNRSFDSYDEGSGTGNVWASNNFGTTAGIF